jgi:hypothetical protein
MPHLEQLAVAHQAASQVIRQLHPFPVNSFTIECIGSLQLDKDYDQALSLQF